MFNLLFFKTSWVFIMSSFGALRTLTCVSLNSIKVTEYVIQNDQRHFLHKINVILLKNSVGKLKLLVARIFTGISGSNFYRKRCFYKWNKMFLSFFYIFVLKYYLMLLHTTLLWYWITTIWFGKYIYISEYPLIFLFINSLLCNYKLPCV